MGIHPTLISQTLYHPIHCEGDMPEDFRKSTRDKVKSDIKNEVNSTPNKNVSQSKRDFFLESNFLLNDLLLSGSVLYGDSLTIYVNKVADQLLKSDPELRSKLRFYTVKSAEVNAFATDPGMIFVTIGLLAELENEAQLAYILAHEIIHYKNRHVINSYLKEEQIAKSGRNRSTDEKVKLISSYSKENELEADSLGYLLYCKSEYNQKEAANTLDIIQFSHLPLDEVVFSNKIFENELYVFSEEYKLDTLREIDVFGDNEDDTYSSHPNIKKRREMVSNQSKLASNNGAKFIIGESYFKKIQQLARNEVLYLYTIDADYMEGYYNAFVMSTKYPENPLYPEIMAKCLYGMAKYKNNNDYSDVARYYNKVEGESQQAYYFFYHLNKPELNSIAAVELFKQSKKNPKNQFLKKLRDDLFSELVSEHEITYDKIYAAEESYRKYLDKLKVDEQNNTTTEKTDTISTDGMSKLEKIRLQKEKKEGVKKETEKFKEFYLLSFTDVLKDPNFKTVYLAIQDSTESKIKREKEEKEKISKMSRTQKAKYYDEQKKLEEKYSKIKMDKLVIVDPYYFEADSRKGLELINSEEGVITFNKNIETSVKAAEVEIAALSSRDMGQKDTDKFNDIGLLNGYYEEWEMHDNSEIICMLSEYTPDLVNKYNTPYFNYSGLISVKIQRTGKIYYILLGALSWPILPIMVVYAFTPIHATQYQSVIFDLEKNEPADVYEVQLKSRSNNSYIKSQIYYQIINSKK